MNAELFKTLPSNIAYTFGRIAEAIPYAGVGVLFGLFNIPQKFEEKKRSLINYIIACSMMLILFMKTGLSQSPKGFGYSGIALNIISSCLFVLFFCLNNIIKKLSINFLTQLASLSKLTLGVYCMHTFIGKVFSDINGLFSICKDGGIINCCIVFLISIVISKTISNISCYDIKKLVK